jgi:Peroxiredoxin
MKKIKLFILAMLGAVAVQAQDANGIMKYVKALRDENDPVKSMAMMKKIIRENNLKEDKDAEVIDLMKGEVAMDYLQAGKYREFENCVYTMRSKFNQTSYLNMGASTLAREKKDLEVAEHLSKKTLDLYNSYKDDPKARPANMPEKDWKRFMTFAFYPYCDTYAEVLHALGKNKEALEYQEKAFDGAPEEGMPSSVERYATLLSLNGQEEKAYSLLLNMAKTGKSTSGMNELLKKLYAQKGLTNFDEFFAGLQKNVVASLKEEFRKKMQDIEAPGFTLKDLDGKTVSLSDFKGKTVVIDFWATWCMPCRASFPAMQKIMKQHPEVKFLYIATQEKQEGALTRVKDFISKNQYPFHVLMDAPLENNKQQFEALSAFKPEGIPAKVIIDPKGRQRFLTIGFSSDTQLINEMEAMLQLVNDLG